MRRRKGNTDGSIELCDPKGRGPWYRTAKPGQSGPACVCPTTMDGTCIKAFVLLQSYLNFLLAFFIRFFLFFVFWEMDAETCFSALSTRYVISVLRLKINEASM